MKVSVIVVSRDRAAALARCVTGLAQLDHEDFELVVVCDRDGAEMLRRRPDVHRIKLEILDEANISRARNRGISRAAGDILAFIDDDAVAEPTWLDRLTEPFAAADVTATGGFVRGRNGVSHQWRASSTDTTGRRVDRNPGEALPKGHVWRTEGTNMAFRAKALRTIGGFDEAFAFYLDETDVNLRLPGRTVIVPEAEVHHGFAESPRRRRDRVPKTLFEIGASSAHFLQKHAKHTVCLNIDELRGAQRRRLLRHMISGNLEPRDVRRLLADLEDGVAEGRSRRVHHAEFTDASGEVFRRFRPGPPGPKVVMSGPWHHRKHLESQAKEAALAGNRPTVIMFAPDPRVLRVRFGMPGIWFHVGGRFGRGLRTEPVLRSATRAQRTWAEVERIAVIRGLPPEGCASHRP